MANQDWENDLDNNIAHVAKELVRGRINFLFGAGMSMQSGGIPGGELAFELIRRAFYQQHDKDALPCGLEMQIRQVAERYPLEAIASGAEAMFPFQETELSGMLEQVVFDDKEPQEHQGHTDMAALVQRLGSPKLLFTTNWDTLIEKALGEIATTITNRNFLKKDLVLCYS